MRRAIVLSTLCALALPALAAAQNEGPPSWWDENPPPGAQDESPPVDVSVGVPTPGASINLSTFQEPLASYGEWVTVPSYGQVWRPSGVAAGWRPYYYGRWEWTDEGWLWVSDEPFGWATYHYGRWAYDPSYGWVWVPGYQWAPAWVTWRYGPDSVGWAPLAPGFSVYVSSYPVAISWWTFMPCGYFVGVPVYRHAYAPRYANDVWGRTRAAPPRAAPYGLMAPAWGGPARTFIEARVGRPVTPVRLHPVGSPAAAAAAGRAGYVPIYRPEGRPAPAPRGFAPGAPGRGPEGVGPRGPSAPRAAPPGRTGPSQQSPGAAPRGQPSGPPRSWAPAPRYEPRSAGGGGGPPWTRREAPGRYEAPRYGPPAPARAAPYAPPAPARAAPSAPPGPARAAPPGHSQGQGQGRGQPPAQGHPQHGR